MSDGNNMIDNDMKEIIESFVSESYEFLESAEDHFLNLENSYNKEIINSIFRAFHSIKGTAGFLNFANIGEVTHHAETLLQIFRKNDITPSKEHVDLLYRTGDFIKKMIAQVQSLYHDKGFEEETVKFSGEIDFVIKNLEELLAGDGKKEEKPAAGSVDSQLNKTAAQEKLQPSKETVNKNGKSSRNGKSKGPVKTLKKSEPVFHKKDIRVDTRKLDVLFDLVGELIIAESMLYNNPDLKGLKLANFKKSFGTLSKITRELQEVTTSIRMIPLEGLFNRMKRLVRDLSHKSGKKVDFLISGKETEMDRNVIELITDPLVHIIRNAIDHGLETPDERKKKKKKEKGKLSLDAKYEGKEIWITVGDDGRGLNREKILAKAKKNGLLSTDGSELSDEEVWRFIFASGFSTADKVTEISGRGVGMDVVNKNITKITGKVDVQSRVNKGSDIIIKIPLTLAIIDGITVRLGNNFYSIPIYDVIEFFKLSQDHLTKTDEENNVIRLRQELLPVIELCNYFKVKNRVSRENEIVVVVKNDKKKVCFIVDEVVGNQQIVVKSLSQYMGQVQGISGCSVMGNGDVSLIMDTGAIIESVLGY